MNDHWPVEMMTDYEPGTGTRGTREPGESGEEARAVLGGRSFSTAQQGVVADPAEVCQAGSLESNTITFSRGT